MAVDEVRALLEEHGLADRLPGLISRWDSLADGNSIVALRHAEDEDLINAGFTEREAKDFLGALRASSPLGASRPASPDHADPEDFLRGRREQRLSARPQLPQTDHTEPEPEPAPLSGLGRASMRDSGAVVPPGSTSARSKAAADGASLRVGEGRPERRRRSAASMRSSLFATAATGTTALAE